MKPITKKEIIDGFMGILFWCVWLLSINGFAVLLSGLRPDEDNTGFLVLYFFVSLGALGYVAKNNKENND